MSFGILQKVLFATTLCTNSQPLSCSVRSSGSTICFWSEFENRCRPLFYCNPAWTESECNLPINAGHCTYNTTQCIKREVFQDVTYVGQNCAYDILCNGLTGNINYVFCSSSNSTRTEVKNINPPANFCGTRGVCCSKTNPKFCTPQLYTRSPSSGPSINSQTLGVCAEFVTPVPTVRPSTSPSTSPTLSIPTISPTESNPTVSPSTNAPTTQPTTPIPTNLPTTRIPTNLPTTPNPTTAVDSIDPNDQKAFDDLKLVLGLKSPFCNFPGTACDACGRNDPNRFVSCQITSSSRLLGANPGLLRITEIRLRNCNLSGVLPIEFFKSQALPYLRIFDISNDGPVNANSITYEQTTEGASVK